MELNVKERIDCKYMQSKPLPFSWHSLVTSLSISDGLQSIYRTTKYDIPVILNLANSRPLLLEPLEVRPNSILE